MAAVKKERSVLDSQFEELEAIAKRGQQPQPAQIEAKAKPPNRKHKETFLRKLMHAYDGEIRCDEATVIALRELGMPVWELEGLASKLGWHRFWPESAFHSDGQKHGPCWWSLYPKE